jgi:hypothetical protein
MTREHVIWAGALQVEKQFGNDGCLFICDRVQAMREQDDINGAAMWMRIADAYGRLAPEVASLH